MHAAEGAARPLLFKGIATQDAAVPFRAQDALELTILMPCLNEAKTVVQCVEAALAFVKRASIRGEVVVADNGSTDGSRELAAAAGARVVPVPQRGYGAALMGGIEAARGSYVIMGDADCSYDFAHLNGFIEKLRSGADLVMGNRFAGGIESGAMPALHRYLGNPVLSFVGRLFFRTSIRDFHCGLRGFSRDAIVRLGLVTPGMEFASEMVAKAALAGLRIVEVPTVLRPDGRDRPPHLRTWRDGWRHLRFLLLFCPRWLFLYPGMLLLATGVTGLSLLSRGTLRVASLGLDIHSLLYMGAATVIGAQMIALALVTKWMAVLAGIVTTPKWLSLSARHLSVEIGLVASVLLMAVGLARSVHLVTLWGEGGFGALDPVEVMRQAIPAVTLMIVGAQVATTGLFAAALQSSWQSRSGSE
jgi:glycosyltransferase involved in cell wall biosynthesis